MITKRCLKFFLFIFLYFGMTTTLLAVYNDSTRLNSLHFAPSTQGYVLATGTIPVPYKNGRTKYLLNITTPQNQPCANHMSAYVSLAINQFNSYQNWKIGQLQAWPYSISSGNTNYNPIAKWNRIATPPHYIVGILLLAWNNVSYQSAVGVSWTLYCLPSSFSYSVR